MDISLALGGGGSRGYAHVGVIRRLEQAGFRIRAVAGSSAGGIIAAFFAAGYTPDEMEAQFSRLDQTKLFGRSPDDGPALLGVAGAGKWLHEHLGGRTFDDLKIPCALTSVDLKSAREIILDRGRLVDAVLATIALPGILPPQQIEDYQLVDGGVLDPVPVSVARSLAPNLPVVAVVLTPLLEQAGLGDKLWVIGGNLPAQDHAALRELGFKGIFASGSKLDAICDYIRSEVK